MHQHRQPSTQGWGPLKELWFLFRNSIRRHMLVPGSYDHRSIDCLAQGQALLRHQSKGLHFMKIFAWYVSVGNKWVGVTWRNANNILWFYLIKSFRFKSLSMFIRFWDECIADIVIWSKAIELDYFVHELDTFRPCLICYFCVYSCLDI